MELHKKPLEVGYMDENHDISVHPPKIRTVN